MTDNFLGADKSLGEPQAPGHREASSLTPGPGNGSQLAAPGEEGAVTQGWKPWGGAPPLCACVPGALIYQNELYQDVQHSGSILGSHG